MRSLYTIAVEMTMVNRVSPVLQLLAHDILHIGHHLSQATLAANRFRTALAGAATAFVGTQGLQAIGNLIDRGNELNRVMTQMRAGGWQPAQIDAALNHAYSLSGRYRSVSAREIMEMQRELAPVLGDRNEAMWVAEPMTKMLQAMQLQFGHDRATQFHGQIRSAVRAAELSANTLRHHDFERYLNNMLRALTAFGGTVTPNDFMQATKYGRASALNWSDEFAGQILPTIIQELGGSSSGTAFMTMYQAMIGGRMHIRSINAWDQLGLINREMIRPENLTPEGRIRRLSPQAIVGSYDFMSNPYDWMNRTLLPAMINKGIITAAGLEEIRGGNLREGLGLETMRKMTAFLAIMFGDRTGQGMADLLALQPRKIERDRALIQQAAGLNGQYDAFGTWIPGITEVARSDYGMAKLGVAMQWQNLNEALALPNMALATDSLHKLSGVLADMVAHVRKLNPETIKAAMIGLGVSFAALVLGGTALLITAIGAWPVVLGAAVAGALASLGYYVWSKGSGWVSQLATSMGNALKALPAMIGEAIAAMAAGIATGISGALRGVGQRLGITGAPVQGDGLGTPGVGGGLSDGIVPQRWDGPPRRGDVQQINVPLYIDGHQIGEAVAYHIAKGNTHVDAAAQFDASRAHMPVDLQTA